MKKKAYISLQITGLDYSEALNTSIEAENTVSELGFCPVNPMREVPYSEGKTWYKYMSEDILLLEPCTHIYMCKGWHKSKGAIVEYVIARLQGKSVINKLDSNAVIIFIEKALYFFFLLYSK